MGLKATIPFKEILTVVKTLTAKQKAILKQELSTKNSPSGKSSRFTDLLLTGPVFTKRQIKTIEDNRKSISEWRTKN